MSLEIISGDSLYRKSGKWNTIVRVIDKENDRYSEIVKDPDTGKIVWHEDEPLSAHRRHGSARQSRDPGLQ
ncbi:MAG TPA: hypothetical protein VF962_02455, partial [Gemmatimonadaceae bacterium]